MPDRIGQQFDNYRLTRLLGTGGFGEVYLAEHIYRTTQVAIKILPPLAQDDLQSFLTEARMFRLKHPNIVQTLDFGVDGRTPFIVMEYAPNGTLRKLHPRGTRVPLDAVVIYVKPVASALQYAHDERLIHRDVKPENMLLGTQNQVLLSDFGIATMAHGTASQRVETMAGTIPYMAPEQVQGHPRPASDQYSLGVVVYEWLCGGYPFRGTLSEVAVQHMTVPPPPLRVKMPTISPAVEQVVMTALNKDPRQRFASVQAFATALEQASQSPRVYLSQPPRMASPSANVELSPGQSMQPPAMVTPPGQLAPQAPSSLPGGPYAPRGISRRKVVVGLAGLVAVGVAGSGFLWLENNHPQPGGNSPVSTSTPRSASTPSLLSTPAPRIMSVSPMTSAQHQTIIITGSGFGTQQPFANTTSIYLNFQDLTGQWRAGYGNDGVGVTFSTWTDNRIEITGFTNYGGGTTFRPGDQVIIVVWNPQTYDGPALFTTTVGTSLASIPTPVSTPAPKITSVSPITPAQYQTIIITGSRFGTNTTSRSLNLQDINGQWGAGYGNDGVGVTFSTWTDNRIEITGFTNYGGGTTFRPGDQVIIAVWNPQTLAGPALFTTTVAS